MLFILIEHGYFKALLNINGVYSTTVTYISATVMKLFVALTYNSNFIYLPNASLEIKFGCNGLESIILYISAVLAYPASFKQKAYGLIIGFIVINIINIVRISLLGYVLMNHKPAFDIMHSYVTQNIMIVLVFFIFIVYLNIISKLDE